MSPSNKLHSDAVESEFRGTIQQQVNDVASGECQMIISSEIMHVLQQKNTLQGFNQLQSLQERLHCEPHHLTNHRRPPLQNMQNLVPATILKTKSNTFLWETKRYNKTHKIEKQMRSEQHARPRPVAES